MKKGLALCLAGCLLLSGCGSNKAGAMSPYTFEDIHLEIGENWGTEVDGDFLYIDFEEDDYAEVFSLVEWGETLPTEEERKEYTEMMMGFLEEGKIVKEEDVVVNGVAAKKVYMDGTMSGMSVKTESVLLPINGYLYGFGHIAVADKFGRNQANFKLLLDSVEYE